MFDQPRLLYVVRHGIAVPRGSGGLADAERPLTEDGERKMRQAARGLREIGVEVDLIVSSPVPRALGTARIIAHVLKRDDRLETNEALAPHQSAMAIRGWLEMLSDRSLMIVGHNPALSNLIGLLLTGSSEPNLCELRKGGVACLSRPAGGGCLLEWLVAPKILRALGEASSS
jgi:phosphohistidine phosphatase